MHRYKEAPKIKLQELENLNIAFNFMENEGVRTTLYSSSLSSLLPRACSCLGFGIGLGLDSFLSAHFGFGESGVGRGGGQRAACWLLMSRR